MTGLHLLLLFGESTITAANKYSTFGCKSGYKSKGGEQGQNSPFTLIQFMTRICALNGWKLILAKTVPCVVECTVYTCSSYYRRPMRTSLSLQSHVLTSLWSNSYAIRKTGGTAPGFRRHLHRWSETTSFRFFFALVAIHKFKLTHEVRRIKVVVVLSSCWLREWAYGQQQARKKIGSSLFLIYDVNCHLKPIAPFHQSSRRL